MLLLEKEKIMKVIPLASDSMGTRSMATYIESDGLKILIDPGVALGPMRDGLPPHQEEIKKMNEDMEKIKEFLKIVDVVIITHYHYDHYNPKFAELLKGKKLLFKDWEHMINRSQWGRANNFLRILKGLNLEPIPADGKMFDFSGGKISFSNPVTHGVSSKLGYVIEVYVESDSSSFLFTSDVQGPCREEQISFILSKKPNIIYIDGPLSYLLGKAFELADLEISINNLKKIMEIDGLECIILDHHLLRDLKWKDLVEDLISLGDRKGIKVMTAAEYIGKENKLLEARRRELYQKA